MGSSSKEYEVLDRERVWNEKTKSKVIEWCCRQSGGGQASM